MLRIDLGNQGVALLCVSYKKRLLVSLCGLSQVNYVGQRRLFDLHCQALVKKAPGLETTAFNKVSRLLTVFLTDMFHSVSPRLRNCDTYPAPSRTWASFGRIFFFFFFLITGSGVRFEHNYRVVEIWWGASFYFYPHCWINTVFKLFEHRGFTWCCLRPDSQLLVINLISSRSTLLKRRGEERALFGWGRLLNSSLLHKNPDELLITPPRSFCLEDKARMFCLPLMSVSLKRD